MTLKTTFGTDSEAKTIHVRYLVVDAPSSYTIIMGRPALNTLKVALSTWCLTLKYPLDNGKVGTLKADQEAARKCYQDSMRTRQKNACVVSSKQQDSTFNINFVDLDPREDFTEQRLRPLEDLKQIQIGSKPEHVTNIGANLSSSEEQTIVDLLRANVDLFAWTPADMLGIDLSFICHRLAISPVFKPIAQRKRKLGPERREAVVEETRKLLRRPL